VMQNRFVVLLISAGLALLLNGCSSAPSPSSAIKETAPEKTPDVFRVKFETNQGPFVIEARKDWAPRGTDRFFELVKAGFYDEARFFRVLPKFVIQFGINKDPKVSELWSQLHIVDDPSKQSNTRGTVTFAKKGPNTRTTQIFINMADNLSLDGSGFPPFGKVVEGMDVVDKLYPGYGEMSPNGNGPDPLKIQVMGNEYLIRNFPRLDFIKTARVVQP
jgi:peptidyl-prolyl cis-trans isomerase A (cyclophilin A)